MGWMEADFYESYTSKGLDKFFDVDYFGWAEGVHPIAPGSKVGNVYYRPIQDKEGNKIIFVSLLSYSASRNTIAVKTMSENSGPYDATCPKRILDIVGGIDGTNDEFAKPWRRRCYERLNRQKLISSIKCGDILRFDKEIHLTSGSLGRFFEYDRRYPYLGAKKAQVVFHFLSPDGNEEHLCTLRGWREMSFRIVSQEEMEAEFATSAK